MKTCHFCGSATSDRWLDISPGPPLAAWCCGECADYWETFAADIRTSREEHLMGAQYDLFVQAKAVFRRRPDVTDEEVAEEIGIPVRVLAVSDGPGSELATIRQARRDIDADRQLREAT